MINASITSSSNGITTGKPNMAIKTVVLPALEAIAETKVSELAKPMQPSINTVQKRKRLNPGNPKNKAYHNKLSSPSTIIRRLL